MRKLLKPGAYTQDEINIRISLLSLKTKPVSKLILVKTAPIHPMQKGEFPRSRNRHSLLYIFRNTYQNYIKIIEILLNANGNF